MPYQFVDVDNGAVLFVRTGVLDSGIVETVQLVHNLVHLEQGDVVIIDDLSNQVQSAYIRFHSTETALLKIHNDIICNMDNGRVTALTLLHLSAAFDTINHSTLLE